MLIYDVLLLSAFEITQFVRMLSCDFACFVIVSGDSEDSYEFTRLTILHAICFDFLL